MTPPEDVIAGLARTVERTSRRVTTLDALVRGLAGEVAELAGAMSAKAAGGAFRSWLLADDPESADADLADLVGWLGRVYLQYPDSALPACWLWHPSVVEELWWLRNAHADAFDPEIGSWLRVGDWHDRQRPGVVQRVRAAAGMCELDLHKAGGAAARGAARPPLAENAAQLASAWATDRTAPLPEPDDAQLHAADTYTREQNRLR